MRYDKGYVDFTRPPPPVKEGDVLTVKIEGMGSSGDGLARVKGFVVFIPNTRVDDEVKVRITKVSRKVGFAELVEDDGEAPTEVDAEVDTEGEAEAEGEVKAEAETVEEPAPESGED
jgi:predicted RNA-binding protein with TRAM domain